MLKRRPTAAAEAISFCIGLLARKKLARVKGRKFFCPILLAPLRGSADSCGPMAKALTKSQIAASIAETAGITKKQTGEILEAIAQLAYKNARNTFTFPGLGKLVLVNRKA